jgi:hypothetical protein
MNKQFAISATLQEVNAIRNSQLRFVFTKCAEGIENLDPNTK